jgi:hypothetical protein
MLEAAFDSAADLFRHYDGVRARLRNRPEPEPVAALPPPTPKPKPQPPARSRDWLMVSEAPPLDAPPDKISMPRWKRIAIEVAIKHKLNLAELLSVRRDSKVVAARYEAMYRMKTETPMSFPEIGRRLGGKDHTTVLYGVRKHAQMLAGQR